MCVIMQPHLLSTLYNNIVYIINCPLRFMNSDKYSHQYIVASIAFLEKVTRCKSMDAVNKLCELQPYCTSGFKIKKTFLYEK